MISLRQVFLITLVVIGVILGLYVLWLIKEIIILLLIAIIFATAIRPLVLRLRRRRLPMAAAILIVYAAIFLFLLTMGLIVIPPFVDQTALLIALLPDIVDFINSQVKSLQDFLGGAPILLDLTSALNQLVIQAPALAARVLQLTFALILLTAAAVLVLVVAFFWLSERDGILAVFLSFVAPQARPRTLAIIDEIEWKLGSYVRGQIFLSAVIGALVFVGLSIIGIDFPVVLAIVAALMEFIPFIGPIISAIPAVIIASLKSPFYALLVIALYIAIHQIEGNVLVPKVMERAVGMSPLTVLLALLIGGTLFGIVGALLAVPVAVVIHVLVVKIVIERRGE